jgi:uncharacterized protein (DUF58 family)
LILDTFTDHPNSEVFEDAVSVAASFAYSIRTQESLLDLLFVGPEQFCFTAGRGLASSDQMLEILAAVQPCRDKSFTNLEQVVVEHVRSVSGAICVFLEWNKDRHRLIRRLKAMGVPLLVMVVVPAGHKSTLEPGPMRDNLARFHKIESGNVEAALAMMA